MFQFEKMNLQTNSAMEGKKEKKQKQSADEIIYTNPRTSTLGTTRTTSSSSILLFFELIRPLVFFLKKQNRKIKERTHTQEKEK